MTTERRTVRQIWTALEGLDAAVKRDRERVEGLERRVAALEGELAHPPEPCRMSVADAARRLGVGLPTIRRMVTAGKLEGVVL